ncbi:uncharacterized protein LOC144563864 [Carex rostrata]
MSQNHEKLTEVMLNGRNYHVWARQVTFALSDREKSDHINPENKAPKQSDPPTDPEKRALTRWNVSDHTVITWLLTTMEPKVFDLLSYKNTALEIWQRAEQLYGHRKNYSHIYQIQRDYQQAKQKQGQPTMELYGYLQKKKDELRIYRPPTTDLAEIQKREEQYDIFQFLASLDSTYEAVRSQILLLAELPTPDEVAAMIDREETRRTIMVAQPLENLETKAFAAMARPNPSYRTKVRGDQAGVKCNHCRREGHRKDQCWFFHRHLRPKWQKKGGASDRKGERGGWERDRAKMRKGAFWRMEEKKGIRLNQSCPLK